MIALLLTAHGFATPSTTYTATLTVSAGAVERAAGSSVTKKLNLKSLAGTSEIAARATRRSTTPSSRR